MAIKNPYTSRVGETLTDREPIPKKLSTLPGTKFLAKRKMFAEKTMSFPAKCRLCVPGSVWTTANNSPVNAVTVDYVTGFGKILFVSFTDTEGNPTGYTPIGEFLSQFPCPVEVEKPKPRQASETPETPETAKRTAITLGSFV